ncbi:MAG: hypothetical protein J0M19_05960 [Sphingomonadales bacterium]|nr:hypothetical protein [Sphingomonadales bacterium]
MHVKILLPVLLALASPALATSLDWASRAADGAPGPTTAAVLGQPDGIATSISFFAASHVRDFKPGKVSAAQLERAMKLPAGELAKWDIIAFESKQPGSGGPGFDSSMWMASDLHAVTSAAYDSTTGNAVPGTGEGWKFRSGRIPLADFKAVFPGNRVFGDGAWILIKLPPVVDKRSPNLAVWLSGGPMGKGDADPAPDAIGVIR